MYGNITTLSYYEIVPEFLSESRFNYFRSIAKSMQPIRRACKGRAALYDFKALPAEVRMAYEKKYGNPDKLVESTFFDDMMEPDMKANKYFHEYTLADGRPLPNEARIEYIRNAQVLNTIVKALSKQSMVQRVLNAVRKGTQRELLQYVIDNRAQLGHTLPDSVDRLAKKVSQYKQEGYSCLVSKKFGNQNGRLVGEELVTLLTSMFATQADKPTRAEVARQFEAFKRGAIEVANIETGELYSPATFPSISQHTVKHYLNKWENYTVATAYRSGDRNIFDKRNRPSHSHIRPQFSGSIISIDDRQPPFKTMGKTRPWFYMGIDLHSEAYVAWVYGQYEDKNSEFLMNFYRQLVRNLVEWGVGIPYELECEAALNSSLKNTLLSNGTLFESVRIHANMPNSKSIERYFRDLRYGPDKKREGWLARPFARSEANQKGPAKEKLLPYSDIIKSSLETIQEWNNMPHSQYPDRTRWEVFMEDQHPDLEGPKWRLILPYLGNCTQTSVRAGQVHLQGEKYWIGDEQGIVTGDKLIATLKQTNEKPVTVYWLDDNEGAMMAAIVCDAQDNYVCHLYPKPKYQRATLEQTEKDHELRNLSIRYENTIEGFIRRGKNDNQKVAIIERQPATLNSKFRIKELAEFKPRDEEVIIEGTTDDEETMVRLPSPAAKSFLDRF